MTRGRRSTTLATPSARISRSNSRICACVLSRSDCAVGRPGRLIRQRDIAGAELEGLDGAAVDAQEVGEMRARKVFPVAGRGDAMMNTAVHGRDRGLRIGTGSAVVADAASTDWLWLIATFRVSLMRMAATLQLTSRPHGAAVVA